MLKRPKKFQKGEESKRGTCHKCGRSQMSKMQMPQCRCGAIMDPDKAPPRQNSKSVRISSQDTSSEPLSKLRTSKQGNLGVQAQNEIVERNPYQAEDVLCEEKESKNQMPYWIKDNAGNVVQVCIRDTPRPVLPGKGVEDVIFGVLESLTVKLADIGLEKRPEEMLRALDAIRIVAEDKIRTGTAHVRPPYWCEPETRINITPNNVVISHDGYYYTMDAGCMYVDVHSIRPTVKCLPGSARTASVRCHCGLVLDWSDSVVAKKLERHYENEWREIDPEIRPPFSTYMGWMRTVNTIPDDLDW